MASSPPRGPHDDRSPVDPEDDHLLERLGVVVPDDASALDAYAVDEQPVWGMPGFMKTRRWRRYGFSGPLMVVVLISVGFLGSLMTLMGPNQSPAPAPLPLATNALETEGAVGGLLPDSNVIVDGVALNLQRLRPAVLVSVPPKCDECTNVVKSLAIQAREFRIRVLLVGDEGQLSQLRDLSRTATNGAAIPVIDPEAALATSVSPDGALTLTFVHADGVIEDIVSNPGVQQRWEPRMTELSAAGASRPVA